MIILSDFPVTRRWPPKNPEVIQLYSQPTPNGIKVSAMLVETGLPFEPHLVDLSKGETMLAEFISLNPNNKIPAIIDPNGPGERPMGLFESGAILQYLAEKSGKFLCRDHAQRWETLSWLHFQASGVGPAFGQLGFFVKFGGKAVADPLPRERSIQEVKRILSVLEKRLSGRDWIMGSEYTIADISLLPWLRALTVFLDAGSLVGLDDCPAVKAWTDRGLNRPAMIKAASIPARPT